MPSSDLSPVSTFSAFKRDACVKEKNPALKNARKQHFATDADEN